MLESEKESEGEGEGKSKSDDYSDGEKDQVNASLANLVAFDLLAEKRKVETGSSLALSMIGRNPKENIGWGK